MMRKLLFVSPLVIAIGIIVAYHFVNTRSMMQEVRYYQLSSRQSIARKVIHKIEDALEDFKKALGRFPKTEEGIYVLIDPRDLKTELKPRWKGPYFATRAVRPKTVRLRSGEPVRAMAYDTAVGTFTLRYRMLKDAYVVVTRFHPVPNSILDKPLYFHSTRGYISGKNYYKLSGSF